MTVTNFHFVMTVREYRKKPCPICEHRAALMKKVGDDEETEELVKELSPKQRQLFVPAEDLLQMPYLREIQFSGSTPGRFNPLAHHFGSQKVIAAAVWEQRPRADAAGRIWEARLYWLKDYDPPFCYRYYTGGDSRPCEAVDPITVLEAVEFPVCEMQQCEGDAR